MSRDLLDDDGENLAVRTFLQLYGATSSITLRDMTRHMSASGFDGLWPEWVADTDERTHLTKGGAQNWLRYLFGLELAAAAPGADDAKDAAIYDRDTHIEQLETALAGYKAQTETLTEAVSKLARHIQTSVAPVAAESQKPPAGGS